MADRRTDAGYWQDREPVIRLEPAATPEMLGEAVQRVMTEAVGIIASTHWKEYSVVRRRLAAAAGFRALGVFDRLARHCTVRESESGIFTIMPKRHGGTRGDDKGFHELPNLEFVVDFKAVHAIGLAVRRGLDLSTWPPK